MKWGKQVLGGGGSGLGGENEAARGLVEVTNERGHWELSALGLPVCTCRVRGQ